MPCATNAQPTLGTDRLILRPLTLDDTDAILKLFADERITEFLGFDPLTTTDQAEEIIRESLDRFDSRRGFRWGIILRTPGKPNDLIGTCGFKNWVTDRASRAEMGGAMSPAYWGTGLMAEALTEMIRFGFEVMNLNRVEAVTYRGADHAAGLLERLGFHLEGIMRQRGYLKGEPMDDLLYSMLKREWDERKGP